MRKGAAAAEDADAAGSEGEVEAEVEEGEVEEEVVDSDGCLPTTRVNGGVESVAKRVVVRTNATS